MTNSVAPSLPKNIQRQDVDPKLREAAEGMEQMFLDYLMKTMRQTVSSSEMSLENPATKIYRGMLDSEYADQAVKAGGIGLAEVLIETMDPNRYNRIEPQRNVAPLQEANVVKGDDP